MIPRKIRLLLGLACVTIVALFSSTHPSASVVADVIGERQTFIVNSSYDAFGRTSISATLMRVGEHAYYYVDDSYLNSLSSSEQTILAQRLTALSDEFDLTIYPTQTVLWGAEPNPGIDNDPRITILLERLTSSTGGYFDTTNQFPRSQQSESNQREMIVGNTLSLGNQRLKIFLAHEFQHLISANQKELSRAVSEEVWLNELRSQYAITAAGYNNDFFNSDLQQRLQTFLNSSTDSVTEWPNTTVDYASVTLFGYYLAERFGPSILSDTLKSSLIGIASINKWLVDHSRAERFEDLFAQWAWANYFNNQNLDPRFGYTDSDLQSFRVPLTDQKFLNAADRNLFSYSAKSWQPQWYQYVVDQAAPADKNIKISWGDPRFKVYYGDSSGAFRPLTDGGVIERPPVGTNFTLIPVNVSETASFGSSSVPLPLSLTIEYTTQVPTSTVIQLADGALIMHFDAPDIYVVTRGYKRLMDPAVLKFYGLDAANAIMVPEGVFQSYMTANYIRAIDEQKVYAVWPDNTKHWLNMSAKQFEDSHRDWNSIFIVNDLESAFYKIGPDIKN